MNRIEIVVCAMFLLAGGVHAQELDHETLTAELPEASLAGDECQLFVPPVVMNGEIARFSVHYASLPAGDREEKFEFEWPSRSAGFSERTVRIKRFPNSPGHPAGLISLENVAVPNARAVEGTFEAVVKVKVSPGAFNCKATATVTVMNPASDGDSGSSD